MAFRPTIARLLMRRTSLARELRADSSGVAAIEFGLIAGTLALIMLNGVEVARYYYGKTQLQNATQMAGQAVWRLCDTTAKTPTSSACTGVSARITSVLQSTSLGGVTVSSGSPTEGWYCASSTGVLIWVGSMKPTNCSAHGGTAAQQAGYYIRIQAQYTYTPLFTTIMIGNSTVTATSMTRLH